MPPYAQKTARNGSKRPKTSKKKTMEAYNMKERLSMTQIRINRMQQDEKYFKELRSEREKRIRDTKKLNEEINTLNRMIKKLKGAKK